MTAVVWIADSVADYEGLHHPRLRIALRLTSEGESMLAGVKGALYRDTGTRELLDEAGMHGRYGDDIVDLLGNDRDEEVRRSILRTG